MSGSEAIIRIFGVVALGALSLRGVVPSVWKPIAEQFTRLDDTWRDQLSILGMAHSEIGNPHPPGVLAARVVDMLFLLLLYGAMIIGLTTCLTALMALLHEEDVLHDFVRGLIQLIIFLFALALFGPIEVKAWGAGKEDGCGEAGGGRSIIEYKHRRFRRCASSGLWQ